MKHTPGPWRIIDHDEEYITITDAEQDFGVCKLEESASENREIMKANAHLISAAPEMLEICELILKEWEAPTAGVQIGELIARLSQYSDLALTAIKKARGEK